MSRRAGPVGLLPFRCGSRWGNWLVDLNSLPENIGCQTLVGPRTTELLDPPEPEPKTRTAADVPR
jgi:hypothetical protein